MITFFTIVLDGMPWIAKHREVFASLTIPWRWIVVEGAASNAKCTSWCAPQSPRLSQDGTTEYLNRISRDSKVLVLQQRLWNGKVSMCNAALRCIKEPCLLWQIDADELWNANQIMAVVKLFESNPDKNCAMFWCRYFVGPDVVVTSRGCWGNNPAYEWKRVWRFEPGMTFQTHEPPYIKGMAENRISHEETEKVGAVFDHMAYATLQQVQFKEHYYAGNHPHGNEYRGLSDSWTKLQENQEWPVRLKRFFPFVDQETIAAPI